MAIINPDTETMSRITVFKIFSDIRFICILKNLTTLRVYTCET